MAWRVKDMKLFSALRWKVGRRGFSLEQEGKKIAAFGLLYIKHLTNEKWGRVKSYFLISSFSISLLVRIHSLEKAVWNVFQTIENLMPKILLLGW